MPKDETKQSVQVTREHLYQQVWKIPLNRLAVEYGISDQRLAKICRRLEVPYPPTGHWSKMAHGKPVVNYQLPPPSEGCPGITTISPKVPRPRLPSVAQLVDDQSLKSSKNKSTIVVPDRLTRPHSIIAGWIAEYESRRRRVDEENDPIAKSFMAFTKWTEMDHRRHRILNALFKALEKKGCTIKLEERGKLYVRTVGEDIQFQLSEKKKQVRRALETYEQRWPQYENRSWRKALQPTGCLVFRIQTHIPARGRTEWLETHDAPLEGMLDEIVSTVIAAGPVLAQESAERQREHERYLESQRKLAEEREQNRIEEARWERMTTLALNWREAQVVREFVNALKTQPFESDETIEGRTTVEWIAWAEERIEATDPLRNGTKSVLENVGNVGRYNY